MIENCVFPTAFEIELLDQSHELLIATPVDVRVDFGPRHRRNKWGDG